MLAKLPSLSLRVAIVAAILVIILGLLPQPGMVVSARASAQLGFATGGSLLNMPTSVLNARLRDMKRLGATWVRVDFSWVVIQPQSPRKYVFRHHDKVVAAADRAGLKVLGVLAYTPKWARSSRCIAKVGPSEREQQRCAPRYNRDFFDFARRTAEHYRSRNIHAWEIWNEPNLIGYWKYVNSQGEFEINPRAYARFATQAAQTIRQVDTVTVLTGGMAPMFEPSASSGMRQSDFLRGMLPYLARGGVTAIGIHPYTWPHPPRRVADWNAFYTVDQGKAAYNLRTIVNTAGRPDLLLWGTEYGASTVGTVSPRTRSTARVRPDHVDIRMQARIIREGVEDWYSKRGVGPLFIYADTDRYLPKRKNEGGFGLRHQDGSPKPAYYALRDAYRFAEASARQRRP